MSSLLNLDKRLNHSTLGETKPVGFFFCFFLFFFLPPQPSKGGSHQVGTNLLGPGGTAWQLSCREKRVVERPRDQTKTKLTIQLRMNHRHRQGPPPRAVTELTRSRQSAMTVQIIETKSGTIGLNTTSLGPKRYKRGQKKHQPSRVFPCKPPCIVTAPAKEYRYQRPAVKRGKLYQSAATINRHTVNSNRSEP